MNLFKSISENLMLLCLFVFFFFAVEHADSVNMLGVAIGVVLVMAIFKAAMEIAEFEMNYSVKKKEVV